ncbi:MAG TPA: phosphate/phosphite/phosphonate ABC transporter substrate-binding protein [Flavihumibacter sp.]|jgi:phosphonate transport system substrate-binding protein
MKKWSLLLGLLAIISYAEAQVLRVATYQYSTNDRIGNLTPLAKHLETQLNMPVTVKSYPTVQAFIEGLQNNEVDLGFINTFGYLLLRTSSTASPMKAAAAWSVPDGSQDVYKSCFVIPKSKKINWDDLGANSAELRLALVFAGSTSGNLVPRLMLTSRGIDTPESAFKSVSYAGTHQAAVEWVAGGKADIAAMGQDAFRKTLAASKEMNDQVMELNVSPEIPLGPALLNQNLATGLREKIIKALIELHLNSPDAMEGIRSGWTEARKATHFEQISPDHYEPFLQQFGRPAAVAAILAQFAN